MVGNLQGLAGIGRGHRGEAGLKHEGDRALGAHPLNSEYVGDGCTSDSMLCGRWWRRGGEARMVAAILTVASLLLIQAVTSIRVRADVVTPVQVGRAQGWLAPATPVLAAGATALVIAGDPIV